MSLITEQMINDLARYGSTKPIDTTGYRPGDTIVTLSVAFEKVGEVVAAFREQVHRIKESADYTPAGRRSRLAELARTTLPRFDSLEMNLASAKQKLQELRQSAIVSDASDGDSIVRSLREIEVRSLLPKDSLIVRGIFMDAIADGDQILYEAIRNAPKFLKLLPADVIAEGELAWETKRNPEKARLIGDLSAAIDTLQKALADARAAVRAEAGLPPGDGLEAIANG